MPGAWFQVIEPIQSRCAIVRFSKLSDAEILERLLYVCAQEKVRSPRTPVLLLQAPCCVRCLARV